MVIGALLPPPHPVRAKTIRNPKAAITVLLSAVFITFLLVGILGWHPRGNSQESACGFAFAVKLPAISEQVAARDISGLFVS